MDSPHSTAMVILSTRELEEFRKAFDDARDDLSWIRAVTGHEYAYLTDDVHRLKRRANSLEALLASFSAENGYSEFDQPELINDIDSGDTWYSHFRSKECKNGDCVQRTFKYSQNAKKRKRGRKTSGSIKVHKSQPIDIDDDDEDEIPENLPKEKVKTDPDYDDYDNMKSTLGKSEKKLEKLRLNQANRLQNSFNFNKKYLQDNINMKRNEQPSNNLEPKEINYDFMLDNIGPSAQDSSQGERIELKDQIEKTQNDLSHEANYKLSKIEQEAMEKKSPTASEWPLKHPDYQIALLMQQKDHDIAKDAPNSYDQKRSIDQDGLLDDSGSIDPDAEIKLKVSNRLMEKGLSASLPSDSLHNDAKIFEKINNLEHKELIHDDPNDLWTRSAENPKTNNDPNRELSRKKRNTLESAENKSTGRKLMTINDYDSIDPNGIDESGNENKEVQDDQESIENTIKEVKTNFKSPTYYKTEVQNSNIESGENNLNEFPERLTKDTDGLTIDFSDALLKSADNNLCPTCSDASKLLKVGSKIQNLNQTSTQSENNETCDEFISSNNVITFNKSIKLPAEKTDSKCNTSSIPNPNTDCKSSSNSISKATSNSNPNQVSLKFGVAFNVTVLNGTTKFEKNNLSPEFGTKKKKKKQIKGYDRSKLLMINKRGIIFPPLPAWLSKRGDKAVSTSQSTEDSGLDFLMSGQLTAQLVNAVLHLVQGNEEFRKDILPGLRRDKVKACTGCNNLNAIKTDKNRDKIDRSEEMLREVMDTISSIIERQVQSKMCVPLCPALKNFYEMVVRLRAENDKKAKFAKKRKAAAQMQNHIKVAKREASDEPNIRRKYSIVKKLLNQYTNLPSDDQEKVKEAKDLLQVHLTYLDELERVKKRKKRNIAQNIFQPINAESRETDPADVTPEFIKLAKTAEIMRKSSRLDDGADYTFLQEDDYY